MVDNIESKIFELVGAFTGFGLKELLLSTETDIDADLKLDDSEAEELMEIYFNQFRVKKLNFDINIYYPQKPLSLNPFKKKPPVAVPAFTIGMLIESAKAGRWLYD